MDLGSSWDWDGSGTPGQAVGICFFFFFLMIEFIIMIPTEYNLAGSQTMRSRSFYTLFFIHVLTH